MRNYTILLGGLEISKETPAQLTDNFSVEFPSPNPRKTKVENIKVWDTNDEQNGFAIFNQAVQAQGWQNPIPLQIIDNTTNTYLFDGFTLPYSPLVRRDIRKKSYVLPLAEYGQDFEEVLSRVHLRQFAPSPFVYTPWNAATNYVVNFFISPQNIVVSFQNKLYKATQNNVNIRPDSATGSNVWQLVGGVPYPTAFTTNDYETIFCVVEEPESPQDAAYWLNAVLYVATLFIIAVEIAQDTIRLFSADLSGSQQVASAFGLLVRGFTFLVLILELLAYFIVPIRKYNAIKVRKLLEKALNHIGYNFQSSILQNPIFDNLVWIAPTDSPAVISGRPTNIPIPDMTLGEFCGIFAQKFKAKFKPQGNTQNTNKVILFETEDFYWELNTPSTGQPNGFIIPSMQEEGEIIPTNYDELHANYTLRFAKDASDRSIRKERYSQGITAMFEIQQSLDTEKQALTKSETVELPVSQAIRKGGDSFFQKLFNSIYDALSFIIGNVDRGGDRRGCMVIPTNNISVDKLFISDGRNLISKDNDKYINAAYLYENYHKKSINKQWIRVFSKAPFVQQPRFAKELYHWNVCQDEEGNVCVVSKFERDIDTQIINLEYRYSANFQDADLITESYSVD